MRSLSQSINLQHVDKHDINWGGSTVETKYGWTEQKIEISPDPEEIGDKHVLRYITCQSCQELIELHAKQHTIAQVHLRPEEAKTKTMLIYAAHVFRRPLFALLEWGIPIFIVAIVLGAIEAYRVPAKSIEILSNLALALVAFPVVALLCYTSSLIRIARSGALTLVLERGPLLGGRSHLMWYPPEATLTNVVTYVALTKNEPRAGPGTHRIRSDDLAVGFESHIFASDWIAKLATNAYRPAAVSLLSELVVGPVREKRQLKADRLARQRSQS